MLRYFLPWWPSDYVWQEWAIANDMTKHPSWTKAYLWDFIPDLLDGILVSRMAVPPSRVAQLRQTIRFHGKIIGDSGAHSYRALDEPPFSCQNLLEFYAQGQFNYGMTLDLVASPWVRPGGLSQIDLENRLQSTIDNAECCLQLHEKHQYPFELIGVVQGWDTKSYRHCAKKLLEMGFTFLAIAGQRNLSLIKAAVKVVLEEISLTRLPVKVHVLGTGNPKILPFYVENKVSSFDSASWLRKAWLDNRYNYFVVEGALYHAYQATRVGLGELNCEQLTWSHTVQCSCPFCQKLGQQILLFRGHERNTRRGFHNIHQYICLLNAHRHS
jgi:tRNA-guanine family transglycosylase